VTHAAIVGSLLGTAVGDALGLPYEGLSPRRAERMLGTPDRYRFVPGRGMVSGRHRTFVHGGPGAHCLRRRSVPVCTAFRPRLSPYVATVCSLLIFSQRPLMENHLPATVDQFPDRAPQRRTGGSPLWICRETRYVARMTPGARSFVSKSCNDLRHVSASCCNE